MFPWESYDGDYTSAYDKPKAKSKGEKSSGGKKQPKEKKPRETKKRR